MEKINTSCDIHEARKRGYLTTSDLARRTGIERLALTIRAHQIPGAVKLDSKRWVFPEKSVVWIMKRLKIKRRF
jgi:hypothetical protein